MDDALKPGDRVAYLGFTKFQMGNEVQWEEGQVIDVIDGQAGTLQMIFSKPDSWTAMPEGQVVRMDYHVLGLEKPVLRRIEQ